MVHSLKELPQHFQNVVDGIKNFEVRKNDRDFKVGDFLALNEYDGSEYTGRCCFVRAKYILDDPQYCAEGCVVIGFEPCAIFTKDGCYRENEIPIAGISVYGRDRYVE